MRGREQKKNTKKEDKTAAQATISLVPKKDRMAKLICSYIYTPESTRARVALLWLSFPARVVRALLLQKRTAGFGFDILDWIFPRSSLCRALSVGRYVSSLVSYRLRSGKLVEFDEL